MKNKMFLAMILLSLSVVYAEDKCIDQPDEMVRNPMICEVPDDAFADIPDNEALMRGKRFGVVDSDKKLVETDLLFVKDAGTVCGNVNVGKNVLVGNQVVFNTRKGCNKLLAKGAFEKNLLNLRSTFCFACDPGLTCTFDHSCEADDSEPAVGCLDTLLDAKFCQSGIEICSGSGLIPDKAEVFISGIACMNEIVETGILSFADVGLFTDIQLTVAIPVSFYTSFCDRPTVQLTYDDNSSEIKRSICVQDDPIDFESGIIIPCTLDGRSVTAILSKNVYVQKVSRGSVWLKFEMTYQNCVEIKARFTIGDDRCSRALQQRVCQEQAKAIQIICKHANKILGNACFDVNVEGRVQ